jgi:2-oxoglutarate/2-oxoacid ferredoxin oxidoreductase subunit beta
MKSNMENMQFATKDFKNGQIPRWCPGCGDYSFLASLEKAMAQLGTAPWNTEVISGIGCSSRLPYYVDAYCFHTIHGRSVAVATGAKVANPKMMVWQISGDGDGLAIGGNHFIHAIRRNIDINMILLNNKIYGLTKGQYSPTSARGFVSKSSPYGTIEDPFHPAELTLGARGHFFARCVAIDNVGTVDVLVAAACHKGASVVEVLQNCVIFNDGAYEAVATHEARKKNAIYLEQGKPMLFGENNEYGLMQEGFGLKVVKLGDNGITEKNILVHDAHCKDNTLQLKLALMDGSDFPVALGVIRDVEAPSYDEAIEKQIETVKAKMSYHSFSELLRTNDIWEIK